MEMVRLLALQEIDTAIDRLTARKGTLESGGELAAARAEADAAERALGELGLQLDVVGRDQARLEHEIESLAQKAAAEDKRLYDGSVVNAKELASIQHEIENLKHPAPVFHGDTIYAETEVLEIVPSKSRPDRGVVKVRTIAYNQDGQIVCEFVRKVMIPTREARGLVRTARPEPKLS